MSATSSVQILHTCVDEDSESEFRILVDGKYAKYLTIEHGVYDVGDMCFSPILVSLLPPLPPGDWNTARIIKDLTHGGRPYVVKSERITLPEIHNVWHPLRIDHLLLTTGKKLRSNVYEATSPLFPSTIVIKLARFAWEIAQLDAETAAYEWIDGHQIGPKFLGHLTEEGRVIGFCMERVAGRHAGIDDLMLVRNAVGRLHALGIRHGDANKHNFLVQEDGDGRVTLIDFDFATKCEDEMLLEEELGSLEKMLLDDSGRGGRLAVV